MVTQIKIELLLVCKSCFATLKQIQPVQIHKMLIICFKKHISLCTSLKIAFNLEKSETNHFELLLSSILSSNWINRNIEITIILWKLTKPQPVLPEIQCSLKTRIFTSLTVKQVLFGNPPFIMLNQAILLWMVDSLFPSIRKKSCLELSSSCLKRKLIPNWVDTRSLNFYQNSVVCWNRLHSQ